jgi:DNA-binding NarL/FixJ family response regulator
LRTARHWYVEAVARAKTSRLALPLQMARFELAATATQMGDLETAEANFAEAGEEPLTGRAVGDDALSRAWLLAARGALPEARAALAEGAAQARESGYISVEALLLTDLARIGGDCADRLAELAKEGQGELFRVRAQFAAARADDDPDALMAAAHACGAIGVHLLAAEAATAASSAYRRAGQSRRATAAANDAAAWAAQCEGARTPGLEEPSISAALTGREREIARLAASGQANKSIATQLTLSVRTVENHLQRIYAKLGITTRAALSEVLRGVGGR